MLTQMKVSGVVQGALLAAVLLGGCAADESATGDGPSGKGEGDVASATSALAVGAPVAWKSAAGTVTGINTAALRADFPDGGRAIGFNVLRTGDGGWALAKFGRDGAGACRTVAARMVQAVDGSLHLGQLNQVIACTSASCPVYPLGPTIETREDTVVLDDAAMSQGSCRPKNDMSGCYCSNDGGGCLSSFGTMASTAFLR